jgi:hypothetical protein
MAVSPFFRSFEEMAASSDSNLLWEIQAAGGAMVTFDILIQFVIMLCAFATLIIMLYRKK